MVARELRLLLTVVVADHTSNDRVLHALTGRELPGLPGSWTAHVTTAPDAPPAAGYDDCADVLAAEADADAGIHD